MRSPNRRWKVHDSSNEAAVTDWKIFLDNHVSDIAVIDFFTVPIATFRVLFCFIVLRHDRRRAVRFNVTEYPTKQWTAQRIAEAFPCDETPKYLIRGPGRDLWGAIQTTGQPHGYQAGADCLSLAVAKFVSRKAHQLHPARVSCPCHHFERGASTSSSGLVFRILPRVPHSHFT